MKIRKLLLPIAVAGVFALTSCSVEDALNSALSAANQTEQNDDETPTQDNNNTGSDSQGGAENLDSDKTKNYLNSHNYYAEVEYKINDTVLNYAFGQVLDETNGNIFWGSFLGSSEPGAFHFRKDGKVVYYEKGTNGYVVSEIFDLNDYEEANSENLEEQIQESAQVVWNYMIGYFRLSGLEKKGTESLTIGSRSYSCDVYESVEAGVAISGAETAHQKAYVDKQTGLTLKYDADASVSSIAGSASASIHTAIKVLDLDSQVTAPYLPEPIEFKDLPTNCSMEITYNNQKYVLEKIGNDYLTKVFFSSTSYYAEFYRYESNNWYLSSKNDYDSSWNAEDPYSYSKNELYSSLYAYIDYLQYQEINSLIEVEGTVKVSGYDCKLYTDGVGSDLKVYYCPSLGLVLKVQTEYDTWEVTKLSTSVTSFSMRP